MGKAIMTRRAWFAYEMDFACRHHPIIYYDELPAKPLGSKEERHDRIQTVEITHLPVGADGEYSFAELQRLYPLQIREDSATREDKEKKEMARPVQGFLTSQGQFFETQEEADFYDAAYELNSACMKAAEAQGFENDEQQQAIASGLKDFIANNAKVVEEFLNARRSLESSGETTEERATVDGPTAGDNPADDPSIQLPTDSSVGEQTDTETVSSRPRKKT